MLILRRKEGQWIDVTCKCGCELRIRTYNIRPNFPGQLDMAFDDPEHAFEIQRRERKPIEPSDSRGNR